MPKPTKGARLGGSASHQRIILANLATQLFEHGKITTTEAKAKRLRPLAEKLITKAKRGDIHSRRLVLTTVRDKGVVHTLFTEIAPTFTEREGGYTRITKVGPRKGDNAPMALIELVTESVADSKKANDRSAAPAKKAPAKKTSHRLSRRGGQHPGRLDHAGGPGGGRLHDRGLAAGRRRGSGRGDPGRGARLRHRGARHRHRGAARAERRHLRGRGGGARVEGLSLQPSRSDETAFTFRVGAVSRRAGLVSGAGR